MLKKRVTFILAGLLSSLTLQGADPFFDDPFGDDIFKEMYQMQKEMDKVFERMHKRMQERSEKLNAPNAQFYMPSIHSNTNTMFLDKGNYYEFDTGIRADKDNEIKLSVNEGMITFRAKVTKHQSTEQQGIQSQGTYTSVMQRSQTLPQDADESSVKMEEKNGVIIVTIQKKNEPSKPLHPVSPDTEHKQKTPAKPSLMNDKNSTYHKVPHSVTQA